MLTLSDTLKYYKRREIQEAILENAENREIAIKFRDKGFGKRPDTLKYPSDVLELVKQGATSFHASEEIWRNPLLLDPLMKKKDVDDLRIGWDLVLDIDFEVWEATKLVTHELVQTLKKHGIKSISCKFSGNKGFHIGVPFEAFPQKVVIKNQMTDTKNLFPESVKRIAGYLMEYIDNKDNNFELTKKILESRGFKEYLKKNNKKEEEMMIEVCSKCDRQRKEREETEKIEFVCPKCEARVFENNETRFLKCNKCNVLMKGFKTKKLKQCVECKSGDFINKINLKIDTLLISSRHLYRMPYSLNEKSGLASIPIDHEKVLEFRREQAKPATIEVGKHKFLDKTNVEKNQGKRLITQAFDYKPETEQEQEKKETYFEEIEKAIPEKFFPPCIKNILNGLEDGRKRSLFILVNFLTSVGWNCKEIEKLLNKWNSKNQEPLKENLIVAQVRYHKQQKKKILPPNCDNIMYYKDFRVCNPDNLCSKIRNPVNYCRRKTRYLKNQ